MDPRARPRGVFTPAPSAIGRLVTCGWFNGAWAAPHAWTPRREGAMSRTRPGGEAIVPAAGIAGAAGFAIGLKHLLSRQAANARAVNAQPHGYQVLSAAPGHHKPLRAAVDLTRT